MVKNIDQLTFKPSAIVDGDVIEISSGGVTWKISITNLLANIGTLKFRKISIPSDPPAEEGVAYLKEIDANNNGLFVKIQKGAAIVEVQIA